jgi:hypothetical protein
MSDEPDFGLAIEDSPRPWQLPEGVSDKFEPGELYLGNGTNPLEVAIGSTRAQPTLGEVRSLWERRRNKRASPVLCVILYQRNGVRRACVCGPAGDDPRVVFGLDLGQTARLCAAALAEPDRHAATRFLVESIPEDQASLVGLRNVGMFATHHLRSGVPERADWGQACEEGRGILDLSDRALVEGLGYVIERRDTTTSLLRVEGAAYAIAVFLEESESPEGGGKRYGGTSPASHALAAADLERLPYAVVTRGRQIRIYATGSDVGVGRKGRTETFVEANLAILPEEDAGYLPLIFGSRALAPGGTFEQILERSRDFATDLGARLRDRVYEHAVPQLAAAVAARHGSVEEPDLEALYEQTLVTLFRLLFIAYAEDKDLLPYHSSAEYSRHALKQTARVLAGRLNEGSTEFDPKATDLWADVLQLFRAIELGNEDWQVPRYNGSLFSSDPQISAAGAAIAELELTNAEVGPALSALLVDQAAERTFGPVDFRSLSVREFGTIYEGLLESDLAVAPQDLAIGPKDAYVPATEQDEVEVPAGGIYLHNRSGARKATGSYFTKPFAVEHLLDKALEPALDDHLARLEKMLDEGEEAAAGEAFFDFRCADLAMGSGHFLVAAVDRIEARLSSFLVRRPVPAVTAELERLAEAAKEALGDLAVGVEIEDSSLLRRQVARRCIYGIDRNLIAVELARLALWTHTFIPGLPLGFLDRTLVHGDSLTGIGTLDEAVSVLEPSSDGNSPSLYKERIEDLIGRTRDALSRLARVSDASAAEVRAAREAVAEAEAAALPARQLFDLLLAIRLGKTPAIEEIDEEAIATAAEEAGASGHAHELQAFHFPLQFPEVFLRERPGFDCILGNPPWEKLQVEEHAFYALQFPGLRGLTQAKAEAALEEVRAGRPDLAAEYAAETDRVQEMKTALARGPYPGLTAGRPDLFKAFAWRFWRLVRAGGKIGIVLPRKAFEASGTAGWRRDVLTDGTFDDITMLINRGGWVFPEVHGQYTVGLITATRAPGKEEDRTISIRGPFDRLDSYRAGMERSPNQLVVEELLSWSESAAVPLLPSERAMEIFQRIRAHPPLAEPRPNWEPRGLRELNATDDKQNFVFEKDRDDLWPVYKGKSFDLWTPDTGSYYAWADPEKILEVLEARRRNQVRNKRSAFYGLRSWAEREETLPVLHPRIAWRDSTNRTNTRTILAALVPPKCVLVHQAYYFFWREGDPLAEAYLLGVISSIPFDWYARQMVESHATVEFLSAAPVPQPDDDRRQHLARLSARLAAVDGRFASWAERVEVPVGSVSEAERDDVLAEIDAAVARLYGLKRDDVEHIFETFHEGWDYSPRLARVLAHFDDLAG